MERSQIGKTVVDFCQISEFSVAGTTTETYCVVLVGGLSKTSPTGEKLANWAVFHTRECNCRTITKESYFGNTAGPLNFQTHTEGVHEKRFLAKGMSTVLFNYLAAGLDIYILVYPIYEM